MNLIQIIIGLPSNLRRFVLLFLDSFLIAFSFSLFSIINPDAFKYSDGLNILIILLIGLPLYIFTGQYKGILRFFTSREFYLIITRNILLSITFFIITYVSNISFSTVKEIILLWLILTGTISFSRVFFRDIIYSHKKDIKSENIRVAIYGAGSAGVLLFRSLNLSQGYKVKFFLDDDKQLWGRSIDGIAINSPHILDQKDLELDYIFLAIPSVNSKRRKIILDNLQKYSYPVLKIPSVNEIISDKSKITDLKPIDIEDLFERKKIPKNKNLLRPFMKDSVFCVTGAGGSIGREICRQILDLSPKKLIILEMSEPSLYNVHQELLSLIKNNSLVNVELIPILGSACDEQLVRNIFSQNKVKIVYHAAAYKHVPLVEINPISGILNNIISTRVVCKAAKEFQVEKMVLISSDKAVRPTNIMGASKRISELIIQAYAEDSIKEKNISSSDFTCFTMVRFGNVLWSSGSVAPLFREQIISGGPITLTHNDITRYFMSIDEASNLVLQASCLAEGGEVFLLDMGEPFQIKKLAEQMIRLSGLTVKNDKNPNGDIEIVTTGLRPGEKLYEELLINSNAKPTSNKLIFKAIEEHFPSDKLIPLLDKLEEKLKNYDSKNSLELVSQLVPKWKTKIIFEK